MPTTAPQFSVVIPTYERRDLVARCLQALSAQTVAPDTYEVIVSIDGSLDGTREMLEQFAAPYALRAIWNSNRGRAAACNAGIRLATGDIVVLLDDDMEPLPEFLAGHRGAHRAHPGCGVIGAAPVEIDASATPTAHYVGMKFNRHLRNLAQPGYQLKFRDFYSGNFSISREILNKVAGFDESFTIYGNEDLELSYRLAKAGTRIIFSAQAMALQRYCKDFAGLARDNVAKGRTAVQLARKHPEVLEHLKIGAPAEASLKWRVSRAWLLYLSKVWPSSPAQVLAFMKFLERRRSPAFEHLCVAAVDYFYWLGARSELRERPA